MQRIGRIGWTALLGVALIACGSKGDDDDNTTGAGTGGVGTGGVGTGSGGMTSSGSGGMTSSGSGGMTSSGSGGMTSSGSGGMTSSGSGGMTSSGSGGMMSSGSGGMMMDGGGMMMMDGGGSGGAFNITSMAFKDGMMIDTKYRCDGAPWPDLKWSGAPAGTKSFTIVFKDVSTTNPTAGTMHWVMYDIPASTTSLPEGVMVGYMPSSPAGAKQAPNYNGDNGFTGPCYPIPGSVGQYEVALYAIDADTLPGLMMSSTAAQVETAAQGNSLGTAKIEIESGP